MQESATPRPPGEETPARIGDFIPAAILAVLGICALVIGSLFSSAVEGEYLLIMQPSLTRAEVLDRIFDAGGGVVGFGGLHNIAYAITDQPDFKASIRADGAWFVLPAPRILGCSTRSEILE